MEVSYGVVLACAVIAMLLGAVWFGPLFGKKWMEANELNPDDVARRAAMQKKAGPLYFIQFLLSLLQLYILAHFVKGWTDASGVETALWIWLGFIMPTIAGASMWNMHSTKVKWIMFLLQSGYQLITFIIFGFLLGYFG